MLEEEKQMYSQNTIEKLGYGKDKGYMCPIRRGNVREEGPKQDLGKRG